jgi:hypothetical protein
MELAIPGVALGLMYIMNNQSNNQSNNENNQEAFGNNQLPNANIPDRNYPTELPVVSEDLDRTSLLSTVNKVDIAGGVYTDKYFDANQASKQQSNNDQPEFYSLTGEKVSKNYFSHDNMVPFFGSKSRNHDAAANSNEGVLDNYIGSGSQNISKKEQSPLFSPNENQDFSNGAPNMNDFYQSRVNKGQYVSNTKPFQEERVAPGLGLGYTNEGSGGFNSGMMMRDSWKPKTADELRVASNPKSSGLTLLGHEGPANSAIKQIATPQQMGIMEKHRPERTSEMGQEHWFTTTGAVKGETLHSMPIDRYVTRPETTTSYSGNANSQNPSTYTTGQYMPSTNIELGAVPMGGVSAGGRHHATDGDYGIKSKKAYPNNRTMNKQDSYFGMVGSSIGAAVAPLLDVLRPSRKENSVGNLRPYQNPGTTVPNTYIFNPADRPSATIRETTENSKNHLNVNSNQRGGAYKVTTATPSYTNRQNTSVEYTGGAGAGDGTRQMTSYTSGYNQRNNDIKSSTIDGRLVNGNMKLLNSNVNMREKTRDESLKNTRSVIGNMPAQSPDINNMGRLAGTDNSLHSTINVDRNTPDIMSSLKKNPYIVDYKKGL